MGIGQWKPQELSTLSEKFYENQDVSFMYRKTLIVGKIEKLLVNSAIVSLPANFSEKTVVSYRHLSIE